MVRWNVNVMQPSYCKCTGSAILLFLALNVVEIMLAGDVAPG